MVARAFAEVVGASFVVRQRAAGNAIEVFLLQWHDLSQPPVTGGKNATSPPSSISVPGSTMLWS